MKHFRKAFYTVFSVIVLLAIGLVVGSIDSADYDDLGLLDQIKNVPDSENGYFRVAYTQKEDFQLFDDGDSSRRLQQHIYHETWDEEFVAQKVTEGARHIERAISSFSYPYFKFPTSKDVGEMPSYLPVMRVAQLIIIKSMRDAKNGRLDEAIQYAEHAVVLSQKIKAESNNWLISHMIGLAMQYEALAWLNHLAIDYELNGVQYKRLLAIFDNIPSYHQDSFSQVFSGEFVFAQNVIDSIIDRPLKERWQEYWENRDWWNADLDNDFGFGERPTKEKLFYLLQALFPKYYVHKNRTLGEAARYYSLLSEQTLGYCSDVSFPETENIGVEWSDLVKPDALTKQLVENTSIFKGYYTRRCFGHAHIESIKTVVAIKSYKNDFGTMPNNLQALVPGYLPSVPVDPFDGSNLKYSPDKEYLYSVGTNFNDDGGSLDSYFVKRCEQSDMCANNPTFPISSALPVKENYPTEDVECEDSQQ